MMTTLVTRPGSVSHEWQVALVETPWLYRRHSIWGDCTLWVHHPSLEGWGYFIHSFIHVFVYSANCHRKCPATCQALL